MAINTDLEEKDITEIHGYEMSKDIEESFKKYEKLTAKKKLSEYSRVSYSTGFPSIDLMLGKNVPKYNDPNVIVKSRGLRDGILMSLAGKTHMGKSVLAMCIAGNVVRPFISKGLPAWIEYFTPEEGLEPSWMETCAGLGNDAIEKKYIRVTHRHATNTSTEGLYKTIKDIYEFKTSNQDNMMYDTEDQRGRPVKKYYPTVIVVDSWSNTFPLSLAIKNDEVSNTFHARKNNINGMFLSQMRPMMLEANIMMIAIVHLGEKIGMDSTYAPQDYATLSRTTSLSGGKIFHFETEFGVALGKYVHPNEKKLEDCLGIPCPNGKTILGTVYKSRFALHNETSVFSLVVDPDFGFHPTKSLYVDMMEVVPVLGSAGAYKYVEGYPEEKFYKKEFYNKFETDKIFREKVAALYGSKYDKYTRYVENVGKVKEIRAMLDDIF